MRSRNRRKKIWAYLDGKKLVEENPGHEVTFKIE